MTFSLQEKDWRGARRYWNEGILARKKKNHIVEEEAGDPKGKKSKEVILKRADPKESTGRFRDGSQGARFCGH